MYFIQQKVSKGIDPPQVLSPDMVPPSERGTPIPVSSRWPIPIVFAPLPSARHQVALAACPAFTRATRVVSGLPRWFPGWGLETDDFIPYSKTY